MDRRFHVAAGAAVVFVCLAGGVSGCAYVKSLGAAADADASAQVIPPEVRSSDSLEALLHYGSLLYAVPAKSLEQEYGDVERRFASEANAPDRIRFALLLSRPGTSVRDDARAKEYLRQVLRDSGLGARPYHDLARFLLPMLDERERLEGALADERGQREVLRQKLEQLKAIEQETGKRIPPKPLKGQQ
jgi:hypothetical protein